MRGTTVKGLKASIRRAADDACNKFPEDAEMRARLFCAFLSGEFSLAEPSLADALNTVAGIPSNKLHGGGAQ